MAPASNATQKVIENGLRLFEFGRARRYLLAPSSRVRRVAAAAAAEAGGCAVGVHLRSQKSKGDYSDVIARPPRGERKRCAAVATTPVRRRTIPSTQAANAYATIRVLLSRAAGGLFVAFERRAETASTGRLRAAASTGPAPPPQ